MNAIPEGRPQVASRFARGVGVAALSTILVVGLAGCMTGRLAAGQSDVKQNPPAPAGIDLSRPADRIVEQIERRNREVNLPSWTDRITAQLEYQAREVHLPSWTDRITAQVEYEASLSVKATDQYRGMTADRIEREIAGLRAQ